MQLKDAPRKSITLITRIGGYYTDKDKNGKYGMWRLLDINGGILHSTMYLGALDYKPDLAEAEKADVFIEHMPQPLGTLLVRNDLTYLGGNTLTVDDLLEYVMYLRGAGYDQDTINKRTETLIKLSRGCTVLRISRVPDDPEALSVIELPEAEREDILNKA